MAISARVAGGLSGGAPVSHQLLDGTALAEQPLAAHVLAAPQAAQLLDLASGRLLPKASSLQQAASDSIISVCFCKATMRRRIPMLGAPPATHLLDLASGRLLP